MLMYQSINLSIHDLAWLAGWLVPGEARIRPWKGFWSICKEIMLRESNLRSPGKIRKLMIWTGWLAGWLVGDPWGSQDSPLERLLLHLCRNFVNAKQFEER